MICKFFLLSTSSKCILYIYGVFFLFLFFISLFICVYICIIYFCMELSMYYMCWCVWCLFRSLIQEDGLSRLKYINTSEGRFLARTLKINHTVSSQGHFLLYLTHFEIVCWPCWFFFLFFWIRIHWDVWNSLHCNLYVRLEISLLCQIYFFCEPC